MKTRQKHFYSHLVTLEDLLAELDALEVSGSEKDDLIDLAHVNLHSAIIDKILSELSEADKRRFLQLMAHGEDDKIWEYLVGKVEKIEDKIKDTASQLKKELKEDVIRLKKNK